jgi:NAD(P)-dependent dehydrogenase (short-subunit alcohol dehydrogenase family)
MSLRGIFSECHNENLLPRELEGKGVIVTGASVGLGNAVARACLQEGASVYLCARNKHAMEAARAALATQFGESRVFAMEADVSKLESAERLVAEASRQLPELMGIVNNAGVAGPKGPVEEIDWTEWVRTIEINLLGTVLCCRAILPHLRRRNYGKIVNLSGGGATAPIPRMSAYAASKAAVVRFTETLAGECAGSRIDVNAVAPGALNTRMLDEMITAGPDRLGENLYGRLIRQRNEGGSSIERAAGLCTFFLSPQSDGITGKLVSAVWDPWETLPKHRRELSESDVYTLRRIVPAERGFGWE